MGVWISAFLGLTLSNASRLTLCLGTMQGWIMTGLRTRLGPRNQIRSDPVLFRQQRNGCGLASQTVVDLRRPDSVRPGIRFAKHDDIN